MTDQEKIIKAWDIINELTDSINGGCTIEQDEIVDIRCLYYKCKEFCKLVENDKKY